MRPIPEGALFYGETRRRTAAPFTQELRGQVRDMPAETHRHARRGYTPRVKPSKACSARSLEELCLTALLRERTAGAYLRRAMRQLLNTLFVTSEDIYLSLDGENVAANREKEVLARYPLHTLSGIIFFAYPGASPALMEACARRGVFLAFRTPRGKFLARACGEANGSVLLRREQYRWAGDPAQSCRAARSMVFGKLYNAYWSIERPRLDHGLRAEDARLDSYMGFLHRDCPGRSSLALDLMEELRPCMADRFVLTLVNNRVLKQADFDFRESGGVYLTDEARRAFLQRRQERKRETPTHPFLGEIIPWGLLTPSVTYPSIWSLEMRFNT